MVGERMHMSLYCCTWFHTKIMFTKMYVLQIELFFISQLHPENIPCALISCPDPLFQLSMDYITSTLAKVWCTMFMPINGILT